MGTAQNSISVTVLQIGTGLPLITSETSLRNPTKFVGVDPIRGTPITNTTQTTSGTRYLVTGGGTITLSGTTYSVGQVIEGDGTFFTGGGTLTPIQGLGRFARKAIIPLAYSCISIEVGLAKQVLFNFVSESVATINSLINP